MAAPQRLQLVGALAAIGPASIAELARHVGRAADSLYRHVRQLERHRLVRRAGERKSGRHVETLYDLTADVFRMRLGKRLTAADRKLILTAYSTMCRGLVRDLRRSMGTERIVLEGPEENLFVEHQIVWLSPKDLARYRRHVAELTRLFDRCRTPRDGTLFMAFLSGFPVSRSRRVADHAPRGPARPAASRKRPRPART